MQYCIFFYLNNIFKPAAPGGGGAQEKNPKRNAMKKEKELMKTWELFWSHFKQYDPITQL